MEKLKLNIERQLDEYRILKGKSVFLRDYASALYMSGATTIRIEKNIERIASAWDSKADFSVLPTCIVLTLWNETEEISCNLAGRIPAEKINFSVVTGLSRLSWNIHDNKLSVRTATAEYSRIINEKRLNPYLVTLLVGFANASFCELFGGDWIAMGIVFFATIDGFYLKLKLPETGLDYRIVTVISACVASIITCAPYCFALGCTPDIALATSVLYLVPGIPFCNAVNDLIYGHYVCSLSRFCHAVIITVCLSLGLCLAFLILNIQFT